MTSVSDEVGVTGHLTVREERAWLAFVDATHALFGVLDRALIEDAGLGLGEYMILRTLAGTPTMRMSDLSDGGLASRSTVSRQVSRLIDSGDIERLHDVADARNRLVRITDRGREHLCRASADHARRVREHLLDRVPPGDLDDMYRMFVEVQEGLR